MKLAILGPYPLRRLDVISGGVEAVIVNMVKGLSRFRDIEIHILTASFSIYENKDYSCNGITIHAVPLERHLGNVRLYRCTRRRLCAKLIEIRPDIVHSHMFGYYTMAALESGYNNLVVSTHGIAYKYWDPASNLIEKIRRYFQDYTYIKCERMARNIIINNPFTERLLLRYPDKRIFRLNNPISDIFFDKVTDNYEEEGRLLFVGNVCEAKGLMPLLYAVEIIKRTLGDIRLFIAGEIVDYGYYRKLIRFIKERGLEECVSFLGQLSDTDLRWEYVRASIFVFPSFQDISPLALLQAMAMGKAIVATSIGGIPYIIDDGVNGLLIKKGDYNSLAEKICILINDYSLRKSLGLNARMRVSEGYSIDAVADKLFNIYREVKD